MKSLQAICFAGMLAAGAALSAPLGEDVEFHPTTDHLPGNASS